MTTVTRAAAFAFAASLGLMAGMAASHADDAFYLGKFKIVDAKPAPWVLPGDELDPSEPKELIGKTITVGAGAIDGPGDFPCKNPQYQVEEGGPEMLYMGSFENMHAQDPSQDMLKLAAQTGFTHDTHFRTVVTGCEYDVDMSFGADNDVARFALNDYIYTITRE
ncbi:MAG TPA: hypothetical protein VHA35_23270 [Dongiaceae bacterium]|nr:hypothetical protein [Dongiaceae bacterium]